MINILLFDFFHLGLCISPCTSYHAYFTLAVVEGPGQCITTIIDSHYYISSRCSPYYIILPATFFSSGLWCDGLHCGGRMWRLAIPSSFFRVIPSVFEVAVAMALHVHLDRLCLTVTVMGFHRIVVVSSCSRLLPSKSLSDTMRWMIPIEPACMGLSKDQVKRHRKEVVKGLVPQIAHSFRYKCVVSGRAGPIVARHV